MKKRVLKTYYVAKYDEHGNSQILCQMKTKRLAEAAAASVGGYVWVYTKEWTE